MLKKIREKKEKLSSCQFDLQLSHDLIVNPFSSIQTSSYQIINKDISSYPLPISTPPHQTQALSNSPMSSSPWLREPVLRPTLSRLSSALRSFSHCPLSLFFPFFLVFESIWARPSFSSSLAITPSFPMTSRFRWSTNLDFQLDSTCTLILIFSFFSFSFSWIESIQIYWSLRWQLLLSFRSSSFRSRESLKIF